MLRNSVRDLIALGLVPVAKAAGKFVPKQRNLVVFGAMKGNMYGDNSRYLFEWMVENRPDVACVWVTHSKQVRDRLRREGLPVHTTLSLRGILALLRASAGTFTNGFADLAVHPAITPGSVQLIALRHGRSVKRVRFARTGHKINAAEEANRRREADRVRYAISTSEFVSDIQEECLQIGREKHVVTGYPRNDFLLDVQESQRAAWARYLDDASQPRVVLYAPTWRHGRGTTRFFPFDDFDEEGLVRALEASGAYLLLRPHLRELESAPRLRKFLAHLARHDQVRLATHEQFTDVNSFLPFVDVLVTDYSALYHDFLLLDRPLIFVPYDYEEFQRESGFLYDYFGNLPGPAVYTFAKFKDALASALAGRDEYSHRRASLTDRVHTYRDAGSRARVAELLDTLIEVP
jgi:CDP-glycerol glycerophosphotransferase (TagB/SpsB family)